MFKTKFVKQSNVRAQFQNSKLTTDDAIAEFLKAGGVVDQIKTQTDPKSFTAK
jgi:hypothetical protein